MEGAPFSPAVEAWRAGLGQVRNAVRQELVIRQLFAHLHDLGPPASVGVLDAGCGQGTVALRLARAGCQVVGVDTSDELLAEAREAAAAEAPAVAARCTFRSMDIANVTGTYDLVCCHGVLMYLPSLDDGVRLLLGAVRSGGLLSVLTRNRAGLAMRAGMRGDWEEAVAAFDARVYRNRIGVSGARADEPGEVAEAVRRSGGEVVAWYGVRLFSDHWGDVDPPPDFDRLVEAEEEAGRRDPYRQVAALTHTIARQR